MEAGSLATTIRGDRALTARSPRSRAIDPVLHWVLSGLAALILILILCVTGGMEFMWVGAILCLLALSRLV